jgi:hypothetical protein
MHKLNPIFNECTDPIISFSLIHYLSVAKEFVSKLKQSCRSADSEIEIQDYNIDFYCKIINPYEYIHSKVPSSKFSVSKIKASSPTFYVLMEILNTFNIFDSFSGRNIKTLHCGSNNSSTIECMNIFRENNNDTIYELTVETPFSILKPFVGIELMTVDFLYFETSNQFDIEDNIEFNVNAYCINLISILCNILTYQNVNGTCIIKLDVLYHKPILDILYLLTSMYDKIYIIKPNASNAFKNERFIVCKNFISDYSKTIENNNTLKILRSVITDCVQCGKNISSLINGDLPYYFLNKIEESNIIIGHLQLEHYDQLINLYKNKNKDDRMETLKKNNIQKCIQWCEKYKIPYNKFVDKLNIFLPIVVYDDDGNIVDPNILNLFDVNKIIDSDESDETEETEETEEKNNEII